MSSEMTALDRARDVPPWEISFPTPVTYLGCAITSVLFAGLLYLWLTFVVPDGVLASDDSPARITLVIGVIAAMLFLLLGPIVALIVGWLLRRSGRTWVHVIAFTFTGSLVGMLCGAPFGPDVALSLIATLGLATGLARLAVTPLAREKFTKPAPRQRSRTTR